MPTHRGDREGGPHRARWARLTRHQRLPGTAPRAEGNAGEQRVRGRIHRAVTAVTGREMNAGRNPYEVSREVLLLLDEMQGLLGEKVLNHAVRLSE